MVEIVEIDNLNNVYLDDKWIGSIILNPIRLILEGGVFTVEELEGIVRAIRKFKENHSQ